MAEHIGRPVSVREYVAKRRCSLYWIALNPDNQLTYDWCPFDEREPDTLFPDSKTVSINLWLPDKTRNDLYGNVSKSGMDGHDFVAGTIESMLNKKFASLPLLDQNSSNYIVNGIILGWALVPRNIVDRLDRLALQRETPRWQVLYEIVTAALN